MNNMNHNARTQATNMVECKERAMRVFKYDTRYVEHEIGSWEGREKTQEVSSVG